jgi:hypothetical protein
MTKSKRPPSEAGRLPHAQSPRGRSATDRRNRTSTAARAHAEAMRQAECAAMLVAVTRLLLNMGGRDYATWLRSVADDFEATDLDQEDPDDVSDDLIRLAERERRTEHDRKAEAPDAEDANTGEAEGSAGGVDAGPPRRPH